ncbi:hypothetical protein DJ021_06530 [Phenylobacterium hankyongense]|uniref:Uncharacterized protein n=1 Tax=Phenylobacterium hankyongense TaxID=1813876 RepID=A0A328AWH5_9CAUL|nr:hypothetical protein [Phenylobacterium hankyongense]RAK59482.1 hypothetical protein DJ021_06530 [Phenylobacterium hankyongense]
MVVCMVAAWRGGNHERLAAGGLLAGWALSMVAYRHGQGTEWGILVIDVALLGLLIWITLRSDRYWPIFAAGFHLLAVLTHLARIVDAKVSGWAYITAEIIWGYLLAAAIGYGAWTYRAASREPESDAAGATRR